jgi:exodeoxyribonuclease V alpha subunit
MPRLRASALASEADGMQAGGPWEAFLMESIDGVLSRMIFHKRSPWSRTGSLFLIGKLFNGTVVKGEMSDPREGENYRFYGELRDQKNRSEQAFEFDSFDIIIEQSVAGVVQYLKSYIAGLGIVKAQALVDHFGDETLTVLRTEPQRAREVSGISAKIAEAIKDHFEDVEQRKRFDPAAYAKLIDLFAGHRISKAVIKKLVSLYRSDAPATVMKNPYLLLALPRMGWKTVDAFALAVAKYDPHGLERHKAAYLEALQRISLDGHTHTTPSTLDFEAARLLGEAPVRSAITSLMADGDLVAWPADPAKGRQATYALGKFADAEGEIAERITNLAATALPLPCSIDTAGLHAAQAEAARLIEENGVAILTGPPGTGKSFTLAHILAQVVKVIPADVVRVAAPTGKAAKRAAELLDQHLPPGTIQCSTIHKLLAPQPSAEEQGIPEDVARRGRAREAFSFGKNEANPLELRLLVVDEFSMADVRLAASLLRAITPGTRLIIVGDENQLPSVGPGSVLRDLSASGVPTARLSEIVRSEAAGRVVKACHALKDGRHPEPARSVGLPLDNWVHVELRDMNAIAQAIVGLHESAAKNYVPGRPEDGGKGFDPVWGMQVVTPQNGRLPIACANLNQHLSAMLNPRPDRAAPPAMLGGNGESTENGNGTSGTSGTGADGDDEVSGPPFAVGDKVVRTKNGLCDQMILVGDDLPPSEDGEDGGDDEDWVEGLAAGILKQPSYESPTSPSLTSDFEWQGQSYHLKETAIVNGDMFAGCHTAIAS